MTAIDDTATGDVGNEAAGIDATRCPLCGGPNGCALADPAGPGSEPCWCVAEQVPRALLGRVPADRLGKACLCRDCVRRARLGEDTA